MTEEMLLRGPVCECNDFDCDIPLGITWEEYEKVLQLPSAFVSDQCKTPRPNFVFKKQHSGYSEYQIINATQSRGTTTGGRTGR